MSAIEYTIPFDLLREDDIALEVTGTVLRTIDEYGPSLDIEVTDVRQGGKPWPGRLTAREMRQAENALRDAYDADEGDIRWSA